MYVNALHVQVKYRRFVPKYGTEVLAVPSNSARYSTRRLLIILQDKTRQLFQPVSMDAFELEYVQSSKKAICQNAAIGVE